MFILYLVKYQIEEDLHKQLILMNTENGRRWTNYPDYLKQIEDHPRDIVSCDEVLTTHSHKLAFSLIEDEVEHQVPPLVGAYEVVQQYGGPEEGGWYYHTRRHMSSERTAIRPELEDSRDRYGEGTVEDLEPVPGYHENMAKQFYC